MKYVTDPMHHLPSPGGSVVRTLNMLRKALLRRQKPSNLTDDGHEDKPLCTTNTQQVTANGIDSGAYTEVFEPLMGFEGVDVYLHGSRADATENSFSDFDDLIVIDREIITAADYPICKLVHRLNAVDMEFCCIDPLQHHGHWIIDRGKLQCYDESYMPLVVLKSGIAINGQATLEYAVDIDRTRSGLVRNIRATVANIEQLYSEYRAGTINCNNLKRLVGSFALLPAFMFQSRGERVDKPQAISMSRDIFSENAAECVRWATRVRDGWHHVTDSRDFRRFSRYPRLFSNPFLYRRFALRFAPTLPDAYSQAEHERLESRSVEAFVAESLAEVEREKT